MSKVDKIEKQRGEDKDRPIQNFPDYLKYVAKKSKAGFDKVHEELSRIYAESFYKTEKGVEQLVNDQKEQEVDTSKTRTGLRKRWTQYGRLWSSTENVKPVGTSFVSYIPEDLGSSTVSDGTDKSFDLLSEEYGLIKQENMVLHNDGICSAKIVANDKKLFDFDGVRYSMPYSELTKEKVYVNDRVLKEEILPNTSNLSKNNDYDDTSDTEDYYAVPKVMHGGQQTHKNDDYVNVKTFCIDIKDTSATDAEINRQTEDSYAKDITGLDTQESYKKNIVNKGPSCKSSRANFKPILNKSDGESGQNRVDDEHDYLPYSQWTETVYEGKNNENCRTNKHELTKLEARCGNVKEVDDYYVPVSDWLDADNKYSPKEKETSWQKVNTYDVPVSKRLCVDYENVPNVKKTPNLYACLDKQHRGSKSPVCKMTADTGEDARSSENHEKTDYDRPTNWTKTVDERQRQKPADLTHEELSEDHMYTNVVKSVNRDNVDGIYSVPARPRPIKMEKSHEVVPKISNNKTLLECDKKLDIFTRAKLKHMNNESEFYTFTVDEVVECLNNCALGKLAKLCQHKHLDGEYFRGLTADDLEGEPFNMNWFHISKLFKVIDGSKCGTMAHGFNR